MPIGTLQSTAMSVVNMDDLCLCVMGGSVAKLKAFIAQRLQHGSFSIGRAIEIASKMGLDKCLEELLKLPHTIPDDPKFVICAIHDLDCFRLLCAAGYPVDKSASWSASAYCDTTEVLQFLHEGGYPIDESVAYAAASQGVVENLQYILRNQLPFRLDVLEAAALGRNGPCLRYLLRECHWSIETLRSAHRLADNPDRPPIEEQINRQLQHPQQRRRA